ncbi:MAG: glutamate--tRNA ligase, partial [Pseudomonadota bacterium]
SQLKAMTSLFLTAEEFGEVQNKVKTEAGVKGKQLFMPIRVAIIGKPHGADLQSLVPLIDRESLIKRVDKALEAL